MCQHFQENMRGEGQEERPHEQFFFSTQTILYL